MFWNKGRRLGLGLGLWLGLGLGLWLWLGMFLSAAGQPHLLLGFLHGLLCRPHGL